MKFTTQDIINENLERRRALAARATAYDPITGERSAGGASHFRFIRLIRGVDCYTQCCALPGEQKKAAEAAFKLWIN
ncbi:MAG: hypothetical protein SPE65_06690 [Muribaculaceae bacterium]|nr:hypothetical protein [Muribaculaceae bacterium]